MSVDDWFLERARVSSKRHTRITIDDKMLFFQQLASLVSSGTPLLQSLELCAQQSLSTKFETLIQGVARGVAAGSTLESAMAQHLNVFEPHWVALIGTGEMSGKMGDVLCDLNEQIRQSRETMRKISGALIYPIILIFVSIIVIMIMLGFVVPTFAAMFEEMNAKLPGITLFVVKISNYIVDYGIYGILGVIGLTIALRKYMKTDEGRRRVGAIGMSIPLVGDLMVQAAMYRFSSNLALLLKSGVPMLDTLAAMANVFRTNPIYRDAINEARGRRGLRHLRNSRRHRTHDRVAKIHENR